MFDTELVAFEPVEDSLYIPGLQVLVDPEDHEGIQIAAANLANDLTRVTGQKSSVVTKVTEGIEPLDGIILVGSIERSTTIRRLITSGALDAQQIEGKWESWLTTMLALSWAKKCFVIAGSDKRGAIFGIYSLCEQIGVSPWHWWADVPVPSHPDVYALSKTVYQGEPSVRYRGLFINDEEPSLTSWVHEKFGPKYNFDFYKSVFELLLRLKANFLWPAMWSGHPFPGSSFFADDPRNQKMADTYGIVVSTSHHEPLQRSTTEWRTRGEGEWAWLPNRDRILKFFEEGAERAKPYESIITMGMRGEGDKRINAEDPKSTLADVLEAQRQVIRETYGRENGERQLMVLYKEVLEYYEAGLVIPDDVTLMFPDDNFGNIRRFPTEEERKRTGGAGLYYHLEYVGRPRGYKWINTNSCAKIYQQLRRAYDHGLQTIWVINVGDLKPLEIPFTFAMDMAWDINRTSPATVPQFMLRFSTNVFGVCHGETIADLLRQHEQLLALRKHEHLEADTLSILNYREADMILSRWQTLEARAQTTFAQVADDSKAAFFQLVLHPIKASRIYTELRIAQAKNQLYGQQRRTSTNHWASRTLQLFDEDFALSEEYHRNPWVGDKWNHIMRQPHYGYSTQTWHDPSRDLITGLCYIRPQQDSNPIMGHMGVAVEGHLGVRPGLINEETDRMHPSRGDLVPGLTLPSVSPHCPTRYFEIYSRGSRAFKWTTTAPEAWISLIPPSGEVSLVGVDASVEIIIDWEQVPLGYKNLIHIDIRSSEGDFEQVHIPIEKPTLPSDFHGFVEADGHISIEPGALPLLLSGEEKYYEHHPCLGRTTSGTIGLRPTQTVATSINSLPFLSYDIFVVSREVPVTVELYITMALDADSQIPLMYDLSLDGHVERSIRLLQSSSSGELPCGWSKAVMDCVWKRSHTFRPIAAGIHRVGFRPRCEGIMLEKLVVDLGGVRQSYLGPPCSPLV
ncbi:hypothetical protein BJX99DRAFT_268711 [Aspergillus californicus]